MSSFFTRKGDDGRTGLLGKSRVSKADPRIETLGSLDEASAALGLARAASQHSHINEIIQIIQHDLHDLMAEIASEPENTQKFQALEDDRVTWLETQCDEFSKFIQIPKEFILPGDTLSSAAFSLARTSVRRAERRLTELNEMGFSKNDLLLKYINRLSSLCFILELYEIQSTGESSTLTKGRKKD